MFSCLHRGSIGIIPFFFLSFLSLNFLISLKLEDYLPIDANSFEISQKGLVGTTSCESLANEMAVIFGSACILTFVE